jgi:YfiH family protein
MGWEWNKGKRLNYLTIPEWSAMGVKLAFSTRNGGVSKSPYSFLNLALHVNDRPEAVLHNRELFLSELGCSAESCVAGEQVHGTKVFLVSEQDRSRGMQRMEGAIPQCDALLTLTDAGLLSYYADCVPLFFYCPPIKLVGLAHAGWQGTAKGIVKEVLTKIKSLGGLPEDCLVAIGPCIGACCYEIGEDVASVFKENFNDLSMFIKLNEGKYKLDLAKANQMQLISEGIPTSNIYKAKMCTACHAEHFYSYRRDGITGRMAAFIMKET